MADIKEGLVEGGAPPADPFEAALEGKGVTGGGSSQTPTVASGLTFAGTPAVEEPVVTGESKAVEGTTQDEEGTDPLHEDPEVAKYLEQFGGDIDKALKSGAHAQVQVGKQGNELGELRSKVDQLTGTVEALKTTTATPAASLAQMSSDDIETALEDQGGVELATWAANHAPHLLDSILTAWGAEEPYKAAVFRTEFLDWQKGQEAAKATTPTPSATEEFVKAEMEGRRMQVALDAVAVDYPDFDAFKEHLSVALEASPNIVKKNVVSSDDNEQREALALVFDKAKILAAADLSKDAKAAADAKAITDKKGARVVTGSLRNSEATPTTDDKDKTREEQEAEFKAKIFEADTTSVRDGLTYAKG